MLLDAEWQTGRSLDEPTTRCLALWSAVARVAAMDAVNEMRLGRVGPAQRWFLSDNKQPASFLWCCDILGLEPDRVRSALYARRRLIYRGER